MIILDYSDKRPIYEQIVEKMQNLILNGVFEPDSKLPSVRSLAVHLSINPNTIQKAYGELERQGFIYPVKGRGNFVQNVGNLAQKEREKVMKDMEEQLKQCRKLGIEKETILKAVEQCYKEDFYD
ncbi:MAG: GntR family transcriptional regulator [Eubacteriales bacterium]|nr:GntR family transcriptional regulator [Eubacteriales bacterium]